MKKCLFLFLCLFLLAPGQGSAETQVTIIYQNDLHGWIYPSSDRVGLDGMARMLVPLFIEHPRAYYAMSGDLLTGPHLPPSWKGVAERDIWNHFCRHLADLGFGDRIFLSAGNHEFDYGLPEPGSFESGLLCANLLSQDGRPFYTPYRVATDKNGFRVGFLGLLLTTYPMVTSLAKKENLTLIPMREAVGRFLPEMGKLDLTVLMIHDHLTTIVDLARDLPPDWGVDLILSGHSHVLLDPPLVENGITILQAGAMNTHYGRADLTVKDGRILRLENRLIPLVPSPLERSVIRVKELEDQMKGDLVAILAQSLLFGYGRQQDTSLGNFVADGFRWATGTDVAMTNNGSLRREYQVFPGEERELREGDFKNMTPFENQLMTTEVTGDQLLQILEGEAIHLQNQVSGIAFVVDPKQPEGRRVLEVTIGGRPLSRSSIYTLTHNSFCARPGNMMKYLHLPAGSLDWKNSGKTDYQVLIQYARHLGRIDYASGGDGRIRQRP